MKCKNCNKKVETICYSTSSEPEVMVDIEKAPCKNCGEENIISTVKRSRRPAEVDFLNPTEIVQYLRDLLNLSDLLEGELNTMMLSFTKKLFNTGWGQIQVHQFITAAGHGTRYDELQDFEGHRVVERPLPQRGEWKEWRKLKTRSR